MLTFKQKEAVLNAGGMLFDSETEAILPGPVAVRRAQTTSGIMADVHTVTNVVQCDPRKAITLALMLSLDASLPGRAAS